MFPKSESPSPVSTLSKLIETLPRFKRVVALSILASLTEGFGIIMLVPILSVLSGGPLQTSRIGGLDLPAFASQSLPGLLMIVLLLIAIRLLVRNIAQSEMARLTHDTTDRLRRDIHNGLLNAEWRWLSLQRSSDHVNMLVSQIGRIGHGLSAAIQMFSLACTATIYGLAAFLLSWQTALAAILAGAFAVVISRRQRERALAFGHALGPLNRAMHRRLQEGVAAIRTTKILAAEASESATLEDAVGQLRAMQYRQLRDDGRAGAISQMASALLITGLIGFGLGIANLGIATLLPLLLVAVRVVPMLEGIQGCWVHWLQAAPAVETANDLVATLASVAEPHTGLDEAAINLAGEIRFSAVSVRYADRSLAALTDFDLTIPARTTTVIAGPSGAGKSTVADVLMGLVEPDSGSMAIDGIPIVGAMRLRWRRLVGYVEQHAALQYGSLRSNLLTAAPGASDTELHLALEAASAGFALALPHGLDTEIGDNGVRLSGGERQRIALAQALLGKPQLLILDEATNALDEANETAILKALAALRGQITIVIISHGSGSENAADRIVRLEAGRVVSVELCGEQSLSNAAPGKQVRRSR